MCYYRLISIDLGTHRMDTQKPLANKAVLITRARDQADECIRLLAERGATAIEFPTIEVIPPQSWSDLDQALNEIETFHWIIFSSANAVRFFMERFQALGKNARILDGIRICAVGPKTAASLKVFGLEPKLVPMEFKAEGVLAALDTEKVQGLNFLVPRAKEAREVIPEKLRERGALVRVVTAYENRLPVADLNPIRSLFEQKKIDVVTFTSSSTVRNFVEMLGQKGYKTLLQGVSIACIGPVCAETAREYGLRVDIMPKEYTVPALVDAMVDFFNKPT